MGIFQQNKKTWEPPVELQRSTPREVQLTGAGKATFVLTVLLVVSAVGAAVWMSTIAASDARRWQAWQAEAVPVQGQVTNLRKHRSSKNTDSYVDYQYRAGDRSYSASAKVRSSEWKRLKQGDPIIVFYRKSELGQSWLSGHEPTGIPSGLGLVAGLTLLAPVPLLVYSIRRQRRLLEEGRAARATVVTTKKVSTQHGAHYLVTYEFETMSGTRRSGKYSANRKPPEIGEQLIVVYHPDEEKWSARYPLALVRVMVN